MKIKSDFITNSSSSSFVIAIKKGTAYKDIEDAISESFNDYYNSMEDWEMKQVEEEVGTSSKEELLKMFASEIVSVTKNGLDLGEWMAASWEYGSEDGGGFGYFVYSFLTLNNDKIKMKGYC